MYIYIYIYVYTYINILVYISHIIQHSCLGMQEISSLPRLVGIPNLKVRCLPELLHIVTVELTTPGLHNKISA